MEHQMTPTAQAIVSLIFSVPLLITSQAGQVPDRNNDHIITALDSQTTQQRIDFLNQLATNSTWPKLKIRKMLKRGNSHSLIPEISKRLSALQDLDVELDLPVATSPNLYSNRLKWAVISFQKRHGLQPDGVIGRRTLAWLNVSPKRRADLLTRNMERQHHFFNKLGDSYLLVNIPQFQLGLIEQGEKILNSRVIVGKQKRQTPEIHSQIKNVVLNPAWNVPRTIVDKDILPKIRSNGNYLAERNYEVYDYSGNQVELGNFDWSNLATGAFPYRLRQKPGPSNALGRVKFFFNNDQAIYLHDTQNKRLFNRYQRAFSSGCIRVEKADELANWFGRERIVSKRHWRNAKKDPYLNQWLRLKEPLPVHLVYWTAWLDGTNKAQFRTDIYKKDTGSFELHDHQSEQIDDQTEIAATEKLASLVKS